VTDLAQHLLRRIDSEGSITFADFMREALYHPEWGYYASGRDRTSWSGDFITSAQLDPTYGLLWCEAFEEVWRACGSPAVFDVVEIGPGEGAFAAAVRAAARPPFADAVRYTLVERFDALRARQGMVLGDGPFGWTPSLDEMPTVDAGVVIANEVLDNAPVHLLEVQTDRVVELAVTATGGSFAFEPRELSDPGLQKLVPAGAAPGTRVEASPEAASLVGSAARVFERGAAFFVDYGASGEELTQRRSGTLVCYSAAGADDDPLDRPGTKDITAHVNWSVIRGALAQAGCRVLGPEPQKTVLAALGVGDLVEETRSARDAALREGRGADAVRAMSRRQALAALTDDAGLGGHGVVAGVKGIEPPAFMRDAREASSREPASS